jgi:putative transposase
VSFPATRAESVTTTTHTSSDRPLIVADGAPGLIKAIEQCWPASDRQHCAVHRVRNLLAKVPERERERVRKAYWQALDDATGERDAKQRLQALVGELDRAGYTRRPAA